MKQVWLNNYENPTTGEIFETDGILSYNMEVGLYRNSIYATKVNDTQIQDIANSINITKLVQLSLPPRVSSPI